MAIIKSQILEDIYFSFYSDQLINYYFPSLLKILIKLLQQESNDQRRLPSPPEIEYGDWSAKKVEETEFDYLDYLDYINYLDDIDYLDYLDWSAKKVEETEFERTARILGVLFPAPPISSATPISGNDTYIFKKPHQMFIS